MKRMKKSKSFMLSLVLIMVAGFTLLATVPGFAACPENIAAYWKLDETTGSNYSDFIGDNDGAGGAVPPAIAPTPVAAGRVNGAQAFDGANTQINVPASGTFNWLTSESFSIEFWIKMPAGSPTNPSGLQVAVGRREPGGGGLFLSAAVNGSGVIEFALNDDAVSDTLTGTQSVTADADWHHVVVVRDGSLEKNLLYIDGQPDGSNDVTYTGNGFISNTGDFNIGWFDFLTDDFYLEGQLDEVAMYNRALPQTEIEAHYDAGLLGIDYCAGSTAPSAAPFPDDTISLWQLDEAAGSTYVDIFGDNDGAGGAVPPAIAPTPVAAGRVNGAQAFDGANTQINVPASGTFNWLTSESFSIEFWIKMPAGSPTNPSGLQVAVGRREPGGGGLFLSAAVNGSGVIEFALNDDAVSDTLTGTQSVTADADWHHVVVVRDGSLEKNLLYIDGQPDGSNDVTYTGNGFISNTGDFNIGWFDFLTDDFYLEGQLDEVAMYNRALPQTEIEAHYDAGLLGDGVQSLRPEPVANAGADQSVTEGDTVTLDGTGSTDSQGGTIASYTWEEVGTSLVTITTGAVPGTATFTAPNVDANGVILTFRLTVTDNDGLSSSATTNVTVNDTAAVVPPPTGDGGGGGGGGCFVQAMF
jgi:hypothetical protein